ncbi:SURF1 family protein [Notoacmeibacter sp. MSK16QG-6]|uniref:SURF1 family protein n=1 Tax=Notoacmeibacter sp. MSK16QG-6 TaxID=2957982 RepID=UPI0020A12173|nr:SURF1 family protein [Notoacmeibacter sp. MSK16QG-6]MCP1198220.1 SURF1 family protein [Notoacmeibacter sp. MSK16QG-6]
MRSNLRFVAATVLIVGAFVVLMSLGTWQVNRLAWKENLLATIDARIHQKVIDLNEIAKSAGDSGGVEFTPVQATGRFVAGKAVFFLATFDGQSGWYVYQPFKLQPGQWPESGRDILLVNRGFVPYDQRGNFEAGEGVASDIQNIEGIAREMPTKKPSSLLPDNEPENSSFFWKDGSTMAAALNIDINHIVPIFVDLGRPGEAVPPGTAPRPGVTQVNLPNNHLSYALTWYGLALVLVGVVAYAIWQSRRRPGSA